MSSRSYKIETFQAGPEWGKTDYVDENGKRWTKYQKAITRKFKGDYFNEIRKLVIPFEDDTIFESQGYRATILNKDGRLHILAYGAYLVDDLPQKIKDLPWIDRVKIMNKLRKNKVPFVHRLFC